MLVESETDHDGEGSMKVSSVSTKWGKSAGLVSRASGLSFVGMENKVETVSKRQ